MGDNKSAKFIKSHKGEEVVETHDGSYLEWLQYIKKKITLSSSTLKNRKIKKIKHAANLIQFQKIFIHPYINDKSNISFLFKLDTLAYAQKYSRSYLYKQKTLYTNKEDLYHCIG